MSGFALLNHCEFLHLSSSVPDDVMSLAWSQLKRCSPSLPDDLLLLSFKNHAMLAHLCEVRQGLLHWAPGVYIHGWSCTCIELCTVLHAKMLHVLS